MDEPPQYLKGTNRGLRDINDILLEILKTQHYDPVEALEVSYSRLCWVILMSSGVLRRQRAPSSSCFAICRTRSPAVLWCSSSS